MRRLHILSIALGTMILVMSSGCKKYLDVNTDPDRPVSAPPGAVLSGSQVALAYVLGGADFSLVTGILTNQVDGADRQFAAYQKYLLVADNFTNPWGTIYQNAMNNFVELRKVAEEKKYPHFAGISKVLTAYTLCASTDVWGDIPYSDAFKGLSFQFKSKYDKQQDIYKTIDQLLTDAIKDLNTPNSAAGTLPGGSDLMYGGSAASWIKFANSIRLRILIHQTKRDPNAAQKVVDAAGAAGGLISAGKDDAQLNFLNDEKRANPLYQFNSQRDGYASYGASDMFVQMGALSDPRIDKYLPGGFYDQISSPVLYITSYEVNFILAEAHARLGHVAQAKSYYEAAIKGSFDKVGADIGDYLTRTGVSFDAATTDDARLALIMTQKYYAMYLQSESFADWRRTGIPALVSKNAGQEIPRRLPYPQTELSYNKENVPTGITLTSRVWWDQ